MRLSRPRSSAVLSAAAAAALFSALPLVSAVPYARDDLHDAGYGYLVPQQCHGGYCGAVNDLCCGVDEACTTVDATPTCVHTSNELEARQVSVFTTTWTETKTFTRTVSSQEQVATTAIVYEQCVPPSGSGQIACGNVCCGSWQYCAYEGQCLDSATAAAAGGTITSAASAYFTTTISGVLTTMYSAPYRVTSGASVTSTTTAANGTAIAATGGGGGGLSGGAIAGIVIGVIAGVILLLLLCFCCLVRGAWGAVSGLFGGRKRRGSREKIVIEEERYVRHDVGAAASAHSRRSQHDSWYNGRPSAAAARKKESGKGLLGMAAGLGTLALLLGLKRDKHAKPAKSHRTRSSTYSSSYYTESYTGSSPSSASSDRRTRQSRGSRGTRTTRHTRTSRRSSRR